MRFLSYIESDPTQPFGPPPPELFEAVAHSAQSWWQLASWLTKAASPRRWAAPTFGSRAAR